MKTKKCVNFPLCCKLATGYIERKIVITKRYFVCEKHAKISMKVWEKRKWSGEDWSSQKFIKF